MLGKKIVLGVLRGGWGYSVQGCGTDQVVQVTFQSEVGNTVYDKMIEPSEISNIVEVTVGPTREAIDTARFISKESSGKMGYAIAEAAYKMGVKIVLVSGPTARAEPTGVNTVRVTSAEEM